MIIEYKNISVDLDIYGEGESVVLLHGFLEERKIWNDFIPFLKGNFQVIVPDLLGHGKTPELSETHTMEELADMVRFILDELKVEKVSLIGHSMGGYVGMAFLEKYTERLSRIMLLNSSPKQDSPKRLEERDQVLKIVQKHKTIFVKSAVSNLFAEKSRVKFKDKLQERIEEAMNMEISAIMAAVKGMKIRKDREQILKDYSGKKFIVAGEEDALIPFEEIKAIAKKTGSRFYPLPGGHMSYIEQQEKVLDVLKEFLKMN